jgi:hypothetical protein
MFPKGERLPEALAYELIVAGADYDPHNNDEIQMRTILSPLLFLKYSSPANCSYISSN